MAGSLKNTDAARLIAARGEQFYKHIAEIQARAGLSVAVLKSLAEADAFACLPGALDRRRALWEIGGLSHHELPLFAGREFFEEPAVALTPMAEGGEVIEDYRSTHLSLRAHPVAFLRPELDGRKIIPTGRLPSLRDGKRVSVAGLVLMRQRPGTAKGVMFITLEDETGHANLIIWPALFERQRREILAATLLICHGRLQREGEVIHVIGDRVEDATASLNAIGVVSLPARNFR